MTADPLGGHVGDPQSLNRYAYVSNAPTKVVDPLGMDPCVAEPCDQGGGSGGWSCTLDGIQVPCDLVAAAVSSGSAAVLPEGISSAGFINGQPYFLIFSDDTDAGFGVNYPGLTDAQVEALGLPKSIGEGVLPSWFWVRIGPSGQGAGDRDYKKELATLLEQPGCAGLLGGPEEAQNQLRRASIVRDMFTPSDPNSIRAFQILAARPFDAVFAGGRIYLGRRFNA